MKEEALWPGALVVQGCAAMGEGVWREGRAVIRRGDGCNEMHCEKAVRYFRWEVLPKGPSGCKGIAVLMRWVWRNML